MMFYGVKVLKQEQIDISWLLFFVEILVRF